MKLCSGFWMFCFKSQADFIKPFFMCNRIFKWLHGPYPEMPPPSFRPRHDLAYSLVVPYKAPPFFYIVEIIIIQVIHTLMAINNQDTVPCNLRLGLLELELVCVSWSEQQLHIKSLSRFD